MTTQPRIPSARQFALIAATAALSLSPLTAFAQWTVINLHPDGAAGSRALAVRYGKQAGFTTVAGGAHHAAMWSGSAASWVDLHPAGAGGSDAYGVDGVQVGERDAQAVLWTGSAGSATSLHPPAAGVSSIRAVWGNQQGGFALLGGIYRASVWTGTIASRVDLHPAFSGFNASSVRAMHGGKFGGVADFEAGMWTSASPDSWVSLKPALTMNSIVWGMDANEQVGQGAFITFSNADHAVKWSGSAASYVDLNPAGSTMSAAYGTANGTQVGVATINGKVIASAWNGTAASWVDLSQFLTGSWSTTEARAIWSDGATTVIVGWGRNNTTVRDEALMWTLSPCVGAGVATQPGSATICPTGSVTFTVAGSGTGPLTYSWKRETAPNSGVFVDLANGPTSTWDGDEVGYGGVVSGAGTDSLTIQADSGNGKRLGAAHARHYRCVISNQCGAATSTAALLTVCASDFNCDDFSDAIDYDAFINAWLSLDGSADVNGDGFVDALDYDVFINAFIAGC